MSGKRPEGIDNNDDGNSNTEDEDEDFVDAKQ